MSKSLADMLDLMYGKLPQRPVVPGGVAANTDSIPGLNVPNVAPMPAQPDPIDDVLDSIYGKHPAAVAAPTPPPPATPAPSPAPADAPPETALQHIVGSLQQLGQRIQEAAQNLMAPPPPPAIDQHALELAAQFRDQTGVGAHAPAMPPLTTPPMQERPDVTAARPAVPLPAPPPELHLPLAPSIARDAKAAAVPKTTSEQALQIAGETAKTVGAALPSAFLARTAMALGATAPEAVIPALAIALAPAAPFIASDVAQGMPIMEAVRNNLGMVAGGELLGKAMGVLGKETTEAFPQADPHASRGAMPADRAKVRAITDMRVAHAPEPVAEPGPVAQKAPQAERIVSASVRNSKGQEFDGPIHAAARDVAYQQGALEPKMADGFRTSEGRFVDRFEARKIAESAGQAAPSDNRLIAEDVRKNEPSFGLTPEQDQERKLTDATAHTQDIVLRQKRGGSSVTDMTTGQPAPVENAPIVTATYAGAGDTKFLPRQVIEDFTREHADKLFDGEHVLTTNELRDGEYELGVAPKTAQVTQQQQLRDPSDVAPLRAAIRIGDHIVTGDNHAGAVNNAVDRGYLTERQAETWGAREFGEDQSGVPVKRANEGYVDHAGNWLTRRQANDQYGAGEAMRLQDAGHISDRSKLPNESVSLAEMPPQRRLVVEQQVAEGRAMRAAAGLPPLEEPVAPVREPAPEVGAKLKVPVAQVRDQNFLVDLSEHTDRAYRESSPSKALEMLPNGGVMTDTPEVFMANTPNLARGQGNNHGVSLEFDTDGLQGVVNTRKPGWETAYQNGEAELVGRYNKQTKYQDALRSVTVEKALPNDSSSQRLVRALDDLTQQGWTRESLDDGRVRYTRPEAAPATRPLIPFDKAPQDMRDEYLGSLEGNRNPVPQATDVVSRSRTDVPANEQPPVELRRGRPAVAPDISRPGERTLAARGAGALVGGAAGYTTGDTPEEKARNAALGAAAGLGLELGLGAATKPAATAAEETASALNAVMDTKARLRQYGGERARMTDITAEAVEDHTARWAAIADKAESANSRISGPARQAHIDFIDRVETGQGNALPPKDQKLGEILREQLDVRTSELLKRGLLDEAIDDYMPRLFKQNDRPAIKQLLGRRPLQGATGFLKRRSYDLYKDAIAAGHEPVTWDPIQQTLLKIGQMDKHIAFDDLKTELKDKGVIESYGNGRVPSGMVPLSDRSLAGYAAPPEVAKVFNNFTANSAMQDEGWFRAMRATSNNLNQVQLLGAFHAGFVGLESVVSQTARGLEAASNGEFGKALGALSHAPVAPVTQILKGSKVLKEWLKPGSFPEFTDIVNAGELAGGRARMDKTFATNFVRNMVGAAREGTAGGYLRAAGWMFPAGIESAMAPLMEHAVPRIKLASFADLMGDELQRLGPAATQEQVRASAQKVWDSIDNRFGQLVYDNLFMNRTVKDIAQLGVRSVGWNAGTIRELGGGALDLPELITKGKLTHRAAYFLSLNTVVPLMGGTMTYLMTGEAPKELKDYYFPRTGRSRPDGSPDRLSLPSYAKDEFAYALHPVRTALSKAGPIARVMQDLYSNQDFYGVQVRDPDAPWQVQAKEIAGYAKNQIVPFSIRGFTKLGEYGESPLRRAGALVGVNPAPAEITRTSFQNMLNERYADTFPSGARTQVEADASHRRAQAVYDIRQGREPDMTGFSHAQVSRIRTQAKTEPDEYKFSHLSLPQQLRLWDEATPEERTKNHLAKHILSDTLGERLGNLPVEERLTVRGRLAEVRKFAQEARSKR